MGITSVSANEGAQVTGAANFTVNVEVNDNTASKDFALRLNVGTSTGDAAGALDSTMRQRGRVPNGLIPVTKLEQLHAIRYDLTGDGQVDYAGDEANLTAVQATMRRLS